MANVPAAGHQRLLDPAHGPRGPHGWAGPDLGDYRNRGHQNGRRRMNAATDHRAAWPGLHRVQPDGRPLDVGRRCRALAHPRLSTASAASAHPDGADHVFEQADPRLELGVDVRPDHHHADEAVLFPYPHGGGRFRVAPRIVITDDDGVRGFAGKVQFALGQQVSAALVKIMACHQVCPAVGLGRALNGGVIRDDRDQDVPQQPVLLGVGTRGGVVQDQGVVGEVRRETERGFDVNCHGWWLLLQR